MLALACVAAAKHKPRNAPGAAQGAAQLRSLLREGQQGAGPAAGGAALSGDTATAFILGLAFPDRIGRQRPGSQADGRKALAGGNEAAFQKGEPLAAEPWVVVPEMEATNAASGRPYKAAPFPEALLSHAAFAALHSDAAVVFWNPSAGGVQGRRRRSFGDIVLSETPLPPPLPAEQQLAAVLEGLAATGLQRSLPFTKTLTAWRARVVFLACHAQPPLPLPDLRDAALLANASHWLAPFLGGVATKQQLASVNLDARATHALASPTPCPSACMP